MRNFIPYRSSFTQFKELCGDFNEGSQYDTQIKNEEAYSYLYRLIAVELQKKVKT